MAPNVQDHVVDEVDVIRNGNRIGRSAERHIFRTIENVGKRSDDTDWRQRVAAIVIAVVICTVIYGVLYLAMHFQS